MFISRIFLRTTVLKNAVLKNRGLAYIKIIIKNVSDILKQNQLLNRTILTIFFTSSAIALKFVTVLGTLKIE
jgi:hypothetical protein